MTIDIFILYRKIYGLNLEFQSYLILRMGLYSGGLMFGEEFVLVSRRAYIRGGLYSGEGGGANVSFSSRYAF